MTTLEEQPQIVVVQSASEKSDNKPTGDAIEENTKKTRWLCDVCGEMNDADNGACISCTVERSEEKVEDHGMSIGTGIAGDGATILSDTASNAAGFSDDDGHISADALRLTTDIDDFNSQVHEKIRVDNIASADDVDTGINGFSSNIMQSLLHERQESEEVLSGIASNNSGSNMLDDMDPNILAVNLQTNPVDDIIANDAKVRGDIARENANEESNEVHNDDDTHETVHEEVKLNEEEELLDLTNVAKKKDETEEVKKKDNKNTDVKVSDDAKVIDNDSIEEIGTSVELPEVHTQQKDKQAAHPLDKLIGEGEVNNTSEKAAVDGAALIRSARRMSNSSRKKPKISRFPKRTGANVYGQRDAMGRGDMNYRAGRGNRGVQRGRGSSGGIHRGQGGRGRGNEWFPQRQQQQIIIFIF